MAENNVSQLAPDTTNRKYDISDDRCDVILDATYEIEGLCKVAIEQANHQGSTDALIFRGLARALTH